MTATRSRKARHDDYPEPTAQPRSMVQELKRRTPEVGLSVSPDDLGSLFLADATEQGNYESSTGEPPELSLLEGADSDEPLVGPRFEQDDSVWEHTVDLVRAGDADFGARDPIEQGDTLRMTPYDDSEHAPRSVDTRSSSILEASLLDRESDEFGEVESPDVTTDDQARRDLNDE